MRKEKKAGEEGEKEEEEEVEEEKGEGEGEEEEEARCFELIILGEIYRSSHLNS